MTWTDLADLLRLFWPALLAAAALGIAAGIVGVFVLLRGEALMALALPQVVSIGVALALRWELQGWHTLPPSLAVAVAALVYFVLAKRRGIEVGVLACLYVAGACVSFLLIANKGQEVSTLQTFFTGIDVAVTPERSLIAAPILLIVAAIAALLWRRWLLIAQAPAAAELAGLTPHRWDALFLVLLMITALLGTDSLGIVLVLVMLFLPAAGVLPWARRIPTALFFAAALAILFLAIGFYLSNAMNWPLSQSIGGVGFGVLMVSHLLARVVARRS